MTASEQTASCYLVAVRLLTGQDYTAHALVRKLVQRQFSVDQAHEAVERLKQEGYLNDQRYAERFVNAARANGRFTGFRLVQELRRRGVVPEVVEQVLQELPDDEHELERARALVGRRYAGFDPQTADERIRRRVAGFLQRRGYRGDLIRQVLGRSV